MWIILMLVCIIGLCWQLIIVRNAYISVPSGNSAYIPTKSPVPFKNVKEANCFVNPLYRHVGLQIILIDGIYWYKDGVFNSDLIKMECI